MKNVKVYEQKTDYSAKEGGMGPITSITPGIAHILENDVVKYNHEPGSTLFMVYRTTQENQSVQLYYNADKVKPGLLGATIDGEAVTPSQLTKNWTFETAGNHIVKYNYGDISVIRDSAFTDCVNIILVYLPKTVTQIMSAAFSGCSNVEYFSFPEVKTVDSYALASFGENKLKTVDLSETKIETLSKLSMCSIEITRTYILPKTIKYIGQSAFLINMAQQPVRKWVIPVETPPTLPDAGAFNTYAGSGGSGGYTHSGARIYVPYSEDHSILELYKNTADWSSTSGASGGLRARIFELNPDGTLPS